MTVKTKSPIGIQVMSAQQRLIINKTYTVSCRRCFGSGSVGFWGRKCKICNGSGVIGEYTIRQVY